MNEAGSPGNTVMSSASTPDQAEALAVDQTRPIKRAIFACLNCRRRKVRCNLTGGRPCTNCRLDGWKCVVPDRKRQGRRQPVTPFRQRNHREHTGRPSVVGNNPPKQAKDFGRDKRGAGTMVEPAETPERIQSQNIWKTAGQLCDRPINNMEDGNNSISSDVTLHHFTYFSFLRAPNLVRLEESDLTYLQHQKSLQIPTGDLLNALLSHYFLYIHPCLPIVNEARFWSIFRRAEENTGSFFSLVVFQAMLFAACSIKALVDFNVEDDSLCISQAALLLSFHSSSAERLSSTTWISLAVNHAHAVGAHKYNPYSSLETHRSDLKRLWWSILLRDRVTALGLRRPLQLHPDQLKNISPEPLVVNDLVDEIHGSEVYDPCTKATLCKILTSQCQLSTVLATLIATFYPSDPTQESAESQVSQAENIDSQLRHWKANCMVPMCAQDAQTHESVQLYKRLTYFYYESARLALYHNASFHLYERQHRQSEHIRLTTSHDHKGQHMKSAVIAINNQVKWFIVNKTVSHLPVSVVAYTILPQLVLNFDVHLSKVSENGRRHQMKDLKFYTELIHMCALRYDIAHMTERLQEGLSMFESSRSPLRLRSDASSTTVSTRSESIDLAGRVLMGDPPGLYFQLAASLDISLSTGRQPKMYSHFSSIGPSIVSRPLGTTPPQTTWTRQLSSECPDPEPGPGVSEQLPGIDSMGDLLTQNLPWDPHFLSGIVPLLQESHSISPPIEDKHNSLPPAADLEPWGNRHGEPSQLDSSSFAYAILSEVALLGE
ncbi:hypothetical protein ABOM_004628 [Aspergillus bombycis]|uniref:Zn(2)-C6 fungal-type domain-containing protein n=1 Tax=Aspergillus bombycis TaxID=109264 RepID=A0A1F8A4I7_9EURO|nr:hypothetical protein ABOM_004628 [Aspergillus bombycis]OGM46607.1 hypothetical protein ABOM_004628 [Aspergillus bombycis]